MPNRSGQLEEEDLIAPRRVRHITSIQVRNLTPFPVRDDSASALVLPSEQPQFSAHGHLSDDLDVTLAKKRGRRRSSASVQSMFAHEAPDGSPIARDAPGRQRAMSKASIATSSSVGLSSAPRPRSSAAPPPARPSHRTRALSTASSVSQVSTGTVEHPVITPRSFPGLLKDTSQMALEKVLQSRLVETFLTISISPSDDVVCDADPGSASLMRKDRQSTESVPQPTRRNSIVAAGSSGVPSLSPPPRRGTLSKLTSSARASPSTAHSRAASTSAVTLSKTAPKPSAPQTLPRSAVSHSRVPSKAATGSVPRPTTPDLAGRKEEHPAIPDFFSSVHRPSTNPAFNIDAREHFDFPSNADLSSARMTTEIWGRVVDPTISGYKGKGKGKERAHDVEDTGLGHQGDEWKVLEHWDVNLNDLIPMPDDLIYHPSRIPSNTLCVTLDPPSRTFYLPSARSVLAAPPRSRSLSPSAGYNSDGESGVRASAPTSTAVHFEAKPNGAPPRRLDTRSSRRKGDKKSATWQDLVRLVDLQAVIKDTASSLSDVVREIDSLVTSNDTAVLTREASQRDAWVTELRGEGDAVEGESRTLKQRLDAKREDLRRRRELLEAARQAHEYDLQQEANAELVLRIERDQLAQLRRRLPVMRNSLITSLAFIYPIELLSPPDLLFTVLGVPLPIPNGPTDPAPPLSLPTHRDVNEDTVATALGYAAQVVQLLAAYLGIGLIYPVTCVGSRSLIKDGISAMVGPRMFPLFSKGVDTYRFEYAVFLLNKDIEMLMAERNLRALDMRHTLPNLKNLLLTLTDPDMVQTMPLRPPSVASATISALQSPIITPSTAEDEPPSLSSSEAGATDANEQDGDSPPASGAATPTKGVESITPTGTVRKSRGFLDLAPLSGFFKARYPSSSRAASKTAEPPLDDEPAHAGDATPVIVSARHGEYFEAEGSDGEDVEDDRRTIRASTSEDDGDEEQKGRAKVQAGKGALTNGNGAAHHAPGEKGDVVDALRSPPVVEGVS